MYENPATHNMNIVPVELLLNSTEANENKYRLPWEKEFKITITSSQWADTCKVSPSMGAILT